MNVIHNNNRDLHYW